MCNSSFPEVYVEERTAGDPAVSTAELPPAATHCFHSQGFTWHLLIYGQIFGMSLHYE